MDEKDRYITIRVKANSPILAIEQSENLNIHEALGLLNFGIISITKVIQDRDFLSGKEQDVHPRKKHNR